MKNRVFSLDNSREARSATDGNVPTVFDANPSLNGARLVPVDGLAKESHYVRLPDETGMPYVGKNWVILDTKGNIYANVGALAREKAYEAALRRITAITDKFDLESAARCTHDIDSGVSARITREALAVMSGAGFRSASMSDTEFPYSVTVFPGYNMDSLEVSGKDIVIEYSDDDCDSDSCRMSELPAGDALEVYHVILKLADGLGKGDYSIDDEGAVQLYEDEE